MLDEYLLKQKVTPKVAKAMEYYVDILVAYESPEVVLVSNAIQRLEPHSDKARLKQYEEKNLQTAKKVLADTRTPESRKAHIKREFSF